MILKEFLETFICRKSVIRLWYPTKGGSEMVPDSVSCNDVSTEWSTLRGEGIYKKYLNHKVIGVTDILVTRGNYTEAINIVIEKIELDDWREQQLNEILK